MLLLFAMADQSQVDLHAPTAPAARATPPPPALPPGSSSSSASPPPSSHPLPPAPAAVPAPAASPATAPAPAGGLPPQAPINAFNNNGGGVAAAAPAAASAAAAAATAAALAHQLYSPSGRKRKQRTSGVWKYFEQFTPATPKGRNVRCTILVDAPSDPVLGLPQRQVV